MGEAGGPEQLKPAVVDGVVGLETVEQRVTRSPSTTSDARSGATASTSTRSDDGQDDGQEREEKDERGAADFRGLLQSMQRQLTFLHTMTRTIAREEKEGSPRRRGRPEASKEDAKQLEMRELDREPQVHECEEPEAESAIGDSLVDSQETRALQVELERLREQLATARQENAQLQATVQRLQSGRSESQHSSDSETDAADGSKHGVAACERIDDSCESERAASGTSIAHSVAPQQDADEVMRRGNVFMDWKPSVALKGHERCQEKTRELCETIRTLALYVQTYSQERSTLIAQRDDAIREAELAWAHNATLASSRNPQQKIKYLQQLKSDNGALRSKVRELQALLVERSLPGSASAASSSNQSQLELPQAIEAAHTETEECHERKHNELLRRLWSRREQLTAHLEQLERERGRARSGSSGGAETPRAAAMTSAPTSPRSLR